MYLKEQWEANSSTSENQNKFRKKISKQISSAASLKHEFMLRQWILRSYYSEGKISKTGELIALEKYKEHNESYYGYDNKTKKFNKIIYHEPFSDLMKKCKTNKSTNKDCICKKMTFDEILNNNLDFLKTENLNKNFANLWITVGKSHSSKVHENNIEDFSFSNDIETVIENTQTVSEKSNVMNKDKLNVKYAILPKPYFKKKALKKLDDKERSNFTKILNIYAKHGRTNQIINNSWDNSNNKIKDYTELQNLDFIDTLNVNDKTLNKNIFAMQVNKYPITENESNDHEEILRFNRLYIFDSDKKNPMRYSFYVEPKQTEFESLLDDSENDFTMIENYTVYIRWGEGWYLRRHIDNNQFTVEIPSYYIDNYNIKINNINYNEITDNFQSGIKKSKNSSYVNMEKFDVWKIDKNEYSYIAYKNDNSRFDSERLEVRPQKLRHSNVLEIEIKEKNIKNDNKLLKWIGYSGIALLFINLIGGD